MERLLDGKVALITGGTRGIGRGIAETFAHHGAQVAFTYMSSYARARELEELIGSSYGTEVKGYRSDAADFAQAEQLIEQVMADFGTIDILVNNAGITRDTLIMRMTEQQWDEVVNTNLKSVFNLSKFATKPMMKARSGSIINVSSIVGIQGNAGQTNYAASKAGIFGFTKSLAKELGSRNIRVNAIAPGFIETEMTGELDPKIREQWQQVIPLKRAGTTTDVANTCLFLASDLSAYVTGQCVAIDGGLAM